MKSFNKHIVYDGPSDVYFKLHKMVEKAEWDQVAINLHKKLVILQNYRSMMYQDFRANGFRI